MTNYDVNYKKLALLLLPVKLRRPRLASFLYAGMTSVQRLARVFDTFRDDTNYRIEHNGQVCHLRAVLNDRFDPYERRIYIEDVAEIASNILYLRKLSRFLYALPRDKSPTLVINRRGFDRSNLYDFAIVLPIALMGIVDENQLKALTNTYKLASKRFLIVYK